MLPESIEALLKQDRDYLWHHLTQHKIFKTSEPLIMVQGQGLILKDIRGREYLDATSGGVWCVNVGYGRDSIADAVCAQLKKMPYYAGTAGNIPTIQFARKVISLLPRLGKVFFSNSGSEANEKAFKMVRQYFRLKYKNKDKYKILYRNRDYHGTTLAALSATGQQERKESYGPFLEGFVEFPHACCYRCPVAKTYPGCSIECALALEAVIQRQGPDTVGAIIVEPITAGGGIIAPVKEYYPLLQEICRKYEVLMIMDEVVCGFGRTGKMFGYEHYDIDPDMVTMAKGMASAYMPCPPQWSRMTSLTSSSMIRPTRWPISGTSAPTAAVPAPARQPWRAQGSSKRNISARTAGSSGITCSAAWRSSGLFRLWGMCGAGVSSPALNLSRTAKRSSRFRNPS